VRRPGYPTSLSDGPAGVLDGICNGDLSCREAKGTQQLHVIIFTGAIKSTALDVDQFSHFPELLNQKRDDGLAGKQTHLSEIDGLVGRVGSGSDDDVDCVCA
jgi:hypothetical protein